jgi:hypothetical protein
MFRDAQLTVSRYWLCQRSKATSGLGREAAVLLPSTASMLRELAATHRKCQGHVSLRLRLTAPSSGKGS